MKKNSNTLIKTLLCTAFIIVTATTVWSQNSPEGIRAGSIVFASEGSFDIIREGQKRNYDPAVEYVEDTEIRVGDYINTYAGSFLEIVLEPGDRILKISEHTSLKIPETGNDDARTGAVQLSYGRIRARVLSLAGKKSFQVRGPSMVAGVRGTDFGYELTALAGAVQNPETGNPVREIVYCLEGSVNVFTQDGNESLLVEAGEMLVKESPEEAEGISFSLVPIDTAISSYWERNDFVTLLAAPEDVTDNEEQRDMVFDWNAATYRKAAAVTGISGALLAGAAVSLWYMDDQFSGMEGRDGIATALAVSGGIFLSTSLLSLIMASSGD